MNHLLKAVVGCVLLLSLNAFAAQPLRIGVDPNLKPFVYVQSDGLVHGFDVDIAKNVCDDLGRPCVFMQMDWDGLLPSLQSGKVDVIISAMSITHEREKVVDFTQSYYKSPSQFMLREEDPLPTKGDTIGVLRGSVDEIYAGGVLVREGIKVLSYDNQVNAMLDLKSGRIKAVLGPKIELQAGLVDTPEGKGFVLKGPLYDDPMYFGPGVGMAVRKGEEELLEALNQSILAQRQDGRWQAASDKYFNFDIWAYWDE